ncbi:MAG: low molecular weight phosphotyrosine protein phosphatase [Lachnospiraceae bacterium]|nr:low molecular weight phosphotyrosine protein phosphatase [Lachnospiraceae bacterium]
MILGNEPLTPSPRDQVRVLFVCWGNICRSPMGEYILKDMVEKRGLGDRFYVESAATSTEEIGNPVYPPARAELKSHGIKCDGHHARQVRKSDYDNFDVIIAMEEIHRNIMEQRFFGGDPEGKIVLCMDLAGRPEEQVEDPWYTGRFSEVYDQITDACEGLIDKYLNS